MQEMVNAQTDQVDEEGHKITSKVNAGDVDDNRRQMHVLAVKVGQSPREISDLQALCDVRSLEALISLGWCEVGPAQDTDFTHAKVGQWVYREGKDAPVAVVNHKPTGFSALED